LCERACEGPACQASGTGEMAFERCDGRGEEAGYDGASPSLTTLQQVSATCHE
jgi:hypothetical protein